jgi:hypothetical protein
LKEISSKSPPGKRFRRRIKAPACSPRAKNVGRVRSQCRVSCHAGRDVSAFLETSMNGHVLAIFWQPGLRVHCYQLSLVPFPSPQSLTWTELVRYWRKASLQMYPEHGLPYQNGAMSLSLHSIIAHTDDPRKRKRANASNTLL